MASADPFSTSSPEAAGPEVPPFQSLVVACSNAFGRSEEDYDLVETICGLDAQGQVWRWAEADPDRPGSQSGWERLAAVMYKRGADPAPRKVQSR